MRLTPESKSVLDMLLAGDTVTTANSSIGPLDNTTRLLLQVLIDNYDYLSTAHGADQAKTLLKAYLDALELKNEKTPSSSESFQAENQERAEPSQENTTPPAWKLHELKCRSIKGVAPPGEEFVFSFDGKSTLLFGPNGSGKSSLLGAVAWLLTGLTFTDEPEPTEIASIHTTSQDLTRGSKIRDWPTISTLPETNDLSSVTPDSMAIVQLKSCDSTTTIYLRRTIDKDLEISHNNQNWMPCPDLSQYGIKPLDLQLSVVAPTIFGRQTIENAPDSRRILSLMLGYDSLEDIGDLVSNLAHNRTLLFNTLTATVETDREKLSTKLGSLSLFLPNEGELKEQLKTLQSLPKLTPEKITEISEKVNDQIMKSNDSLAKILGITKGYSSVSATLAENLIKAVGHLERGFSEVCPSLSSIEIQSVLPQKDGVSPQERLSNLQQSLESFTSTAQAEIAERLQWWRKETAPASKAKLLLLAAQSYDPSKIECPVCEQSIKDRPVKSELESLRTLDPKLLEDLKLLFTNLGEKLDNIVPQNVRSIADILPADRLLSDWDALKVRAEFTEFSPILEDFQDPIIQLVSTVATIAPELPQLVPSDAEPAFRQAASSLISEVNAAYVALAILRWSGAELASLRQRLCYLITTASTENPSSLLAVLSKGKTAAQEVGPLKTLQTQLSDVETDNDNILQNRAKLDTLESLKLPLDNLKNLSKYAIDKTNTIFAEIKDRAVKNWKLLYPEDSTGLYPSRLVVAGRKDKSIESLLSHGNYEVPGPPFANAGLQRAIALSFLCALLDKHPHGLGFVIFDDPILSLDEDHRERWSREILMPCMENTQIILATHQRQFLTNRGHDFASGQVVELNPRNRKRRISWQPGNHLDKAEKVFETHWDLVPGILYNYCEGLLETLDSYSPQGFFNKDNFTQSMNGYEKLSGQNPLASSRQKQIVASLKNVTITSVFAGRHEPTKHNVTKPMVQDAINKIRELNNIFTNELEDLKRLKTRERKGSVIQISTIPFPDIPQDAIFRNPLVFSVLGRAAARPESWVLDSSEEIEPSSFAPYTAVFVSSNVLNPVIRYGQCVFLASEDIPPHDDDLVVVVSDDGNRYLRKLWSDGEAYILQAINPTKPIPPIRILKSQAVMRKIIGVLYDPPSKPIMQSSPKTLEWYPYSSFPSQMIESLKAILVEGDSLDPIARPGQKVLVSEPQTPKDTSIEDGGLAALEIAGHTIGNVIKRVHPGRDQWTLISPNPVEPHRPDIIPTEKIKQVWPIRGVLFETADD